MISAPALDTSRLAVAKTVLEVFMRTYHRAEATGVENLPDSGALLVGNHSGGLIAMDVPAIALAYWKRFGIERPLHVLAHDLLMKGPVGNLLRSLGFVNATKENAQAALRAGGATIVFPGGDYDVYRPTSKIHTIDFNRRTGYVRTAIEAGVPIVPVVSIGGHETQIVLSRGESIAKYLPFAKLVRSRYAPITVGFPWGITMGLPQLPLPTKIVTRFLEPIDPADHDNDVQAVDILVRERMQAALDELAAARRFPVLG
jgi:1-acyl-sn-glycerol-3-phosphate acyltransferase